MSCSYRFCGTQLICPDCGRAGSGNPSNNPFLPPDDFTGRARNEVLTGPCSHDLALSYRDAKHTVCCREPYVHRMGETPTFHRGTFTIEGQTLTVIWLWEQEGRLP